MPRIHSDRTTIFWLGAFLALGAAALSLQDSATDDAYIHFRIARSLVQTGAPYYNPDQAVMATSSPLWTLVVALIYAVTGQFNSPIAILNALLTTLTARAVTADLTPRHQYLLAGPIVGSLYLSAFQQMETPLALCLISFGLKHIPLFPARSGLLLGLAVLTRYEALIFLLLGAMWIVRRTPSSLARFCGPASGILALGWGAVYTAYGTIIPQTVRAKSVIYQVDYGQALFLAMSEFIGKRLVTAFPALVAGGITVAGVLIIIALLTRKGQQHGTDNLSSLLLIGGGAVFAAYLAAQVFVFPWYAPLYATPIAAGLFRRATLADSIPVRALAVIVACPLAAGLAMDIAAAFDSRKFSDFPTAEKTRRLGMVGASLHIQYPEAEVLAAEIGALGFFFHGRIIDGAGLASPQLVKFHRRNPYRDMSGAIPPGAVESLRPDIVVGLDLHLRHLAPEIVTDAYVSYSVPISGGDTKNQQFQHSSALHILIRKDINHGFSLQESKHDRLLPSNSQID